MNVIVNTVSPCTYPTIGFEERFKDGRGVDRFGERDPIAIMQEWKLRIVRHVTVVVKKTASGFLFRMCFLPAAR